MEELKEMLSEEIKGEFEALSALEFGSKEHSMAVDNLTTLYKLRLEEAKSELDAERQERDNEIRFEEWKREDEIRLEQQIEQTKDRYIRLGMEAAGLILPLLFYGVWMKRGFKFEESGAFTSTTFRGLFNRFKPTRK